MNWLKKDYKPWVTSEKLLNEENPLDSNPQAERAVIVLGEPFEDPSCDNPVLLTRQGAANLARLVGLEITDPLNLIT